MYQFFFEVVYGVWRYNNNNFRFLRRKIQSMKKMKRSLSGDEIS